MKRTLLLTILALFAIDGVLSAQNATVNGIVTISMQEAFDNFYKREEGQERFRSVREEATAEAQEREAQLKEYVDRLTTMREEMENPMLSDEGKAAKEEEARKVALEAQQKQREFQEWQQRTLGDIQRREQEFRATLINEIREVAIALGKDRGASILMDTSDVMGSGVPPVLYADPRLDITNAVISELNKDAPARSN